jgi:hypothetical protein
METTLTSETQAATTVPSIGQAWPGIEGSVYAGIARGAEGQAAAHLVLLPNLPDGGMTWQAAKDWAQAAGGHLPSRDESALLYAHAREHINTRYWYWTSTQYSESFAWSQYFDYGDQVSYDKKYEARARAVRRFTA